jgi:hypothetical protein
MIFIALFILVSSAFNIFRFFNYAKSILIFTAT